MQGAVPPDPNVAAQQALQQQQAAQQQAAQQQAAQQQANAGRNGQVPPQPSNPGFPGGGNFPSTDKLKEGAGWAMEKKDDVMGYKEQAEEAADNLGVSADFDGVKQLGGNIKDGASTLREMGGKVGDQNLGTGDVDDVTNMTKKLIKLLPYHPSVAVVFIILLGLGIYILLLITTAVKITEFEIITTCLYAAMSFMDLLRERLVYLTDNNLVYGEVMGRQFLTQPREFTLAWIWLPGAYFTGDLNTFYRVLGEMWLVAGILILSQLDNNSFKEGNDTGFEPETLGSLCLVLGCFTVLPVTYLCWRGTPMTEENKKKIEVRPGFEKAAFFFEIMGVLKKSADSLKEGDVGGGLIETAKRLRRASQEWNQAEREGKSALEAQAAARQTMGMGGNFGSEDLQPVARAAIAYDHTGAGAMAQPHMYTMHQQEPVMVHGHRFGEHVGEVLDQAMNKLEDMVENEKGEHEYFDKEWEETQYERVNDNKVGEGFEVLLGSPDKDFKAQVMPILGVLAAFGSALFYQGLEDETWVWENDDGEIIDLSDRIDKAGKLLMVFAWTALSQLASAAFKDTDMEIKAKRKMTELEIKLGHNGGALDEQEMEAHHREIQMLTEAEPVGIMEGLKNAFFNPGWLCRSEKFIEQEAKKVNGKWEPTGLTKTVSKWLGMLWLTAVMANLAKYGVAARGAFFAWAADEPKTFVFWYVWLEFGLISFFIAVFYGISFRVISRNPNLRSNYVPNAADPPPPPEEPAPPVARDIQMPPLPLWTGGGGGLGPLPGYINGGFQPRAAGAAPPPLYMPQPGFVFGPNAPTDPNLFRPLPGYRGL